MTLRDICKKDVIQIDTGTCLGRIDDIDFDTNTSEVERFILLGRPRWFGLFGSREESLYIPWNDVVCFGVDAILVRTDPPAKPSRPPALGRNPKTDGR